MIEYIIYGIVDNFIMILGSVSGHSFEKYLPKRFRTGFGAVYGAGIGTALSDFLGGMSTWSLDLAMGTSFGCILALIFIPIFIYIGKLRVNKNG